MPKQDMHEFYVAWSQLLQYHLHNPIKFDMELARLQAENWIELMEDE